MRRVLIALILLVCLGAVSNSASQPPAEPFRTHVAFDLADSGLYLVRVQVMNEAKSDSFFGQSLPGIQLRGRRSLRQAELESKYEIPLMLFTFQAFNSRRSRLTVEFPGNLDFVITHVGQRHYSYGFADTIQVPPGGIGTTFIVFPRIEMVQGDSLFGILRYE